MCGEKMHHIICFVNKWCCWTQFFLQSFDCYPLFQYPLRGFFFLQGVGVNYRERFLITKALPPTLNAFFECAK
jgi:hypothetical protein